MKLHALCLVAVGAFWVAGCSNTSPPDTKTTNPTNKDAPSTRTPEETKDKKPKILATAPWASYQLAPRTGFIRDRKGAAMIVGAPFDKWNDVATQEEASAKLAKLFTVDKLDWSKQMVLLVEAGQRQTGGDSVEVTTLEVKGNVLIVYWKVNEPKPGSPVVQGATNPGVVL